MSQTMLEKPVLQAAAKESAVVEQPILGEPGMGGSNKDGKVVVGEKESSSTRSAEDRPDDTAQEGVQIAEAIAMSWDRKHVMLVYCCFWLMYFMNALESQLTANLSPYILSGFEEHSLVTVIGIVTSVISAATYMPVAKMVNLWDRTLGFTVMVAFSALGMILSATCNNIGTYCAAQVFYSVGFVGMIFSVDIITADTSSVKDRGLAYAFTSSPYIITAFAGPKAAEGFYADNWRWAYGMFAILIPVVAIPLVVVLELGKSRAKKNGLIKKSKPTERTLVQNVKYYLIEFDIVGMILLAAGTVLFLLAFTLAQSAKNQWKSAHIIAMMVVGFCTLVAFAFVERYLAPRPFAPYHLLTSRTVIGSCLLCFTYQIAYYCWASYFTSYLQVVYNTSISVAGYISSTFDVVAGVWLLIAGVLIKKTGYFKWLLLFSVPLYILGAGLMIHFRQPDQKVGWVVFCQVLISWGGASIILVEQVAITAVADHNDVASMLALLGLVGYIGGAVGNSISGAIWTNVFPVQLQERLPANVVDNWEDIYGSLDVQLSYPVGSAARSAIMAAYAYTQERMLIAGVTIMALSLVWMLLVRNINVKNIEQVKGVLF